MRYEPPCVACGFTRWCTSSQTVASIRRRCVRRLRVLPTYYGSVWPSDPVGRLKLPRYGDTRHHNSQPFAPYLTRGVGGRQVCTSAENSETAQGQNSASAPRSRAVEKRGVEFARGGKFAGIVRSRNRRVYRLVLLGATPGFQPDGRPPIPPLPGAEESCALHNQCPVGRCAATRARSLRHGLLSPELAAGIHRVKGAKRLGVRIGNWLTIEQARALLQQSPADALRAKLDRAILAVLIGFGLRRAELVALKAEDFQIREEH
jgi:hypothetical protein